MSSYWNKFYFNPILNRDNNLILEEQHQAEIEDVEHQNGEYEMLEKTVDNLVREQVNVAGDVFIPNSAEQTKNKELEKLVITLCQEGFYILLESVLRNLNASLKYSNPVLCIVGKNLHKFTPDHRINHAICFSQLLNYKNIGECINDVDGLGCSALFYAAQFKNNDFILELLRKGALLVSTNKLNELPIKNISASVLEEYFDSCVHACDFTPGTQNYEITVDYSGFTPTPDTPKTLAKNVCDVLFAFKCIAESRQLQHLVTHPLIKCLVRIKWFDMRSIFFYNILLCCMLLTTGYHLAFNVRNLNPSLFSNCITGFTYCTFYYLICRELFQFLTSKGFLKWDYFLSLANFVEIIFIVILYILLQHRFDIMLQTEKSLTAAAILLIAFEINIISQTFPFSTIPIYVQMFQKVAYNFFKLFLIYGGILIAFTVAFHVLFRPDAVDISNRFEITINNTTYTDFEHIFTSSIKTFVMFSGEFDAGEIGFKNNEMSYVVFVLFVFFVSLVLSNLLQGLAVSDIQKIVEDAEINRIYYRINVMERYQNYLKQYPLAFIGNIPWYCEKFLIFVGCRCLGDPNKFYLKNDTKFNAIKSISIYPNLNHTKLQVIKVNKSVEVVKNGIERDSLDLCRNIIDKRESMIKAAEDEKQLKKIDEIYSIVATIEKKLDLLLNEDNARTEL